MACSGGAGSAVAILDVSCKLSGPQGRPGLASCLVSGNLPPPPTLAATSVTPSHLQQLSWVALLRLASSGQECGNGHGSGGSSRGVEFRHFRGENATQVCCEEGKPPCPPPPPPIPPTPAPVPPWVHHRCIHSGWLHRSLYTFAADHTPRFITVGEGKHHPCRPPFANCNRLASPTLLHPDTSASQ